MLIEEKLLDEKLFETFPTRFNYRKLFTDIVLNKITKSQKKQIYRHLCQNDLYFLLRYAFDMSFISHPWAYARACEVMNDNMFVDVWAREHFKSTFKTKGQGLQRLIKNPTWCNCNFSHTKDISKAFHVAIVDMIKTNKFFYTLFDDIFYPPDDESNMNDKLINTRQHPPGRPEPSLSYGGLVKGMPTGMHYDHRNYDDIVNDEAVSTPEQMEKLEHAFQMSQSLGRVGTNEATVSGTYYHHADLLHTLKEQKNADGTPMWTFREYPAEDAEGHGVFMSDKVLAQKRVTHGSYIYACQYLLNPSKSDKSIFKYGAYKFFDDMPPVVNDVVMCDPALSKKGCYAVVMYVAITSDHRLFVDHYWSKIGARNSDIVQMLFNFWQVYKPRHIAVETVQYQMALKQDLEDKFVHELGRSVEVDELKTQGQSKVSRVVGLQPYYENGQIYIRSGMTELIEQTRDFPLHKYADHIDLLAYAPLFFKRLGMELAKEKIDSNVDRSAGMGYNRNEGSDRGVLPNVNRVKRLGALGWRHSRTNLNLIRRS